MALLIRNKMDLHEKALYENAVAQAEQNRALLEYIMMMADIELPEDEEEPYESGEEDE